MVYYSNDLGGLGRVVLLLDPFFDWVEFFLSLMDGFRLPIGGDGSGIG